jgi:CheY-like chemotaxis protein
MRLEIDQVPGTTPYTPTQSGMLDSESQVAELLDLGIRAAKNGDRAAARTALLECTERDPQNESAWLWLASISEYPEELLVFLKNVLSINPANQKALEWRKATSSLMAKTFVERGAVAVEQGSNSEAAEHFNSALDHDPDCTSALMWLASIEDSEAAKINYLEKVVAIDPEHSGARDALSAIRHGRIENGLAEAKAAAVAGRTAEAFGLLEAVINDSPDHEEAWMLRSMFTDNFAEKIRSFERVLEINPDNAAASASLQSLRMLESAVPPEAPADVTLNTNIDRDESYLAIEVGKFDMAVPDEKHPTQDLEMPEGVVEAFGSPEPSDDDSISQDTPVSLSSTDLPFIAEAELEASDEWDSSLVAEIVSPEEFSILPPNIPLDPAHSDNFEIDPYATVIVNGGQNVHRELHSMDAILPQMEAPSELEATVESIEEIPQEFDHNGDFVNDPDSLPESIGVEARRDDHEPELRMADGPYQCPFCKTVNEPLAASCQSCMAGLTLSDLELLLENHHVDRALVRQAVEQMEIEKRIRKFSEYELTMLGIGHLNIGNYETGYAFLLEATQENPNNVVLASYVNGLHIRIEEIRSRRESAETMTRGKTILVIDDSPTIRKLISGKLEKSGHNVFCSADGVEALERLQDLVPDLILLDIAMPRMDGYQVCKMIRANEATKDVAVVMISGKDGFFDKVRGRMAGTSGYITKPFGPETLMKIVEMYLQNVPIEDFSDDELSEDE